MSKNGYLSGLNILMVMVNPDEQCDMCLGNAANVLPCILNVPTPSSHFALAYLINFCTQVTVINY